MSVFDWTRGRDQSHGVLFLVIILNNKNILLSSSGFETMKHLLHMFFGLSINHL